MDNYSKDQRIFNTFNFAQSSRFRILCIKRKSSVFLLVMWTARGNISLEMIWNIKIYLQENLLFSVSCKIQIVCMRDQAI